jgi:hypothetical protein
MPPPIEDLAAVAYIAFLNANAEYLPPFVKEWNDLPQSLRQAWIEAVRAVLVRAGNA